MCSQVYDNGGAEAIKGFNFHKANLILLAINNYKKKDFNLYIEAEDDIVIEQSNYRAIIQVKKQKHTFKTITKQTNKKKKDPDGNNITEITPSILEKNLRSGIVSDTFKIIVQNFGEKDIKKMTLKKPGTVCSEIYELDDKGRDEILKVLPVDLIDKIDKFFVFISPINTDLIEAEKYLIGSLNKIGVSVDDQRGRIIIAELSLTIDQKSQEIISSGIDKEIKSISQSYLNDIFVTSASLDEFNLILNSLNYNSIFRRAIKKERIKIELNNTSLKERMKKSLNEFLKADYESITDREIVDFLLHKYKFEDQKEATLISIAIESICEIGAE